MRRIWLVSVCLLFIQVQSHAQTDELEKFEVGAEFTTLSRRDYYGLRGEPGFGGRFTYNLNKNVALETSGYFFPRRCFVCESNGSITEVVGGIKAGKRFKTFGLFAKARPGVVSFSRGQVDALFSTPPPNTFFQLEYSRLTHFATDVGGVVEFYPSRKIVARFDAGDTIVYMRQRTSNGLAFVGSSPNSYVPVPLITPGKTTHDFQFSASVGFRF